MKRAIQLMIRRFLILISIGLSIFQNKLQADVSKHSPFFLLGIKEHIGKGIGYRENYTSLDLFSSTGQTHYPIESFIDVRLHRLQNGNNAVNTGFGCRYLPSTSSIIYGANLYYDYRQLRKENWHQMGIGLEILSDRINFRINGYLPLEKTQTRNRKRYDQFIGDFYAVCKEKDFSFKGIDTELEWKTSSKRSIRYSFAAGSYYYLSSENSRHILGGKARICAQFKQLISLQVSGSYDPIFKTRVQGQISVTFPLINAWPNLNNEPLIQSVHRQEIIPLDHHCCWDWNW